MEPVYIVTGYMRSFTSALMRAADAGGIPAVWNTDWEAKCRGAAVDAGYDPNPTGFYEANKETRQQFHAHPEQFAGQCIKLLANYGHIDLPRWEGRYNVAMLMRNPADIRKSYKRYFGYYPVYVDKEKQVALPLHDKLYITLMDWLIAQMNERDDVTLKVVEGEYLIDEPRKALAEIGWPLDLDKAVAAIQPELCRNRHEPERAQIAD